MRDHKRLSASKALASDGHRVHPKLSNSSPPTGRGILRNFHKWVTVKQLLPVVKGLLLPGGPLYEKSHAERKQLLINYIEAVAQTFPDAWSDDQRKNYSLLQPTGLQIMLALLPDVMLRCDFYEGFSYSLETFKHQLEPLVALALLGNWGKTAVAEAISVRAKREMFLGQLKEALRVKPV